MEIIFDVIGETLVAELFGELDHYSANKVRERIDKSVDNYGMKNLIFDFSRVSFMDSSGIGMVLGRYRRMGGGEGRLAIAGCSESVRNILNLAGVFSVIGCYNTKEEAVAAFDGKEVS